MTATIDQIEAHDPGVGTSAPSTPHRVGRLAACLVACVVIGAALRVVWATHYGLSFDETFTAMAGRRSITGLLTYVRDADSHPPLDALLRLPFARAGASDVLLRLPSLVFSIGALALFAWWMRTRGVAGVVATGLFAISGFAIAYGSEARMYALLQLLGVAAAVMADGWLRAPRRAHAIVVGALVLVGCLDHTSMFLLVAGLLALPGFRRDRDAWRWRAGVVVGLGAWAVLWGVSFITQFEGAHASWIPPTTARAVVDAVTSLVTFTDGVAIVVVVAVVGGAIHLARTDRPGFRVWCACGVLPVTLAAAIGAFTPFFLNRTLTLALWAPILAVGVATGAVWERWRPLGVAAILLLAVVAVPGTVTLLRGTWQYDESVGHLESVVRPGDVVAVVPAWYSPLVDWRIAVRAPVGATSRTRVDIPDSIAYRVRGAPATGRIVLLEFGANHPDLARFGRCATTWAYSESRIRCLVVPPSH